MPRTTGPKLRKSPYDQQPALVVEILTTIALGVVAYVLAVVIFFALQSLVQLPGGTMMTPELRTAFFYVLLAITVILLTVPMFNPEAGGSGRLLLGTATFLILFAISEATRIHFLDPHVALDFFRRTVIEPLQHLNR